MVLLSMTWYLSPVNIDLNALFWIISMLSDKYIGKFVCHTGHAYSRTGRTILIYTIAISCWLIPARFNCYSIYNLFDACYRRDGGNRFLSVFVQL